MNISTKNYIPFYLIGVAIIAALALFFISFYRSRAQVDGTAELNTDLIQAKADLMGWQEETSVGNLTSADYRTAFSANLQTMKNNLQSDSDAMQ